MTDAGVVFETETVSTETLATLGEGHIAYVKQIRSEDVPGLFPQAPKIAPGLKLFALHAADGTPIMLTDSREAAIAPLDIVRRIAVGAFDDAIERTLDFVESQQERTG